MAAPTLPTSAPRLRGLADFVLAFPAFLLLVGLQSPGKIVSDTKYDLLVDPVGFLSRSLHIWTDESFAGQVQNQSYGYFFPHGAFFALGQFAHIPPWITERLWWALALTIGFTGILRLARSLGIGRTPWRIVGALTYVGAPKVLTSLGTISSEIWPMMLAPWVMLAVHAGLTSRWTPRRAGAAAALAVALMGAVNAVATVAACVPALLWLLTSHPNRTWRRLLAWWAGLTALASIWWIVPLFVLGRVAPPFLDYIESAAVTSRWSALVEVLRGSSAWVPYVSPTLGANEAIVATSLVIIATVLVAGAGLAGLAWPGPATELPSTRPADLAIPHRGRLTLMVGVGLCLLTAAYAIPGPPWLAPSFPFATAVQDFLDGAGAPLRNAHKWEPVLRLPLALATTYFLTRAAGRLPKGAGWRAHALRVERIERYPGLAGVCAIVLALVIALVPVWRGDLAANGPHDKPAEHWSQAADWLATNAADSRALVTPGSSFGVQVWGTSRDEPIQPLAESPWAVRDSIPLQPAPAIRALDSVQRVFDSGRPSPGLAATLAGQGIGYVVVRSDLVPTPGGTRPALVHRALADSGGFTPVARFGDEQGAASIVGDTATATVDSGLRPQVPSVVIYRVGAGTDLTPYSVPLDQIPQVAGGPEALGRLDEFGALRQGMREAAEGEGAGSAAEAEASPEQTTRLLAKDAEAAGLGTSAVIGTDTPGLRETDFGRSSQSTSALRSPGQERTTLSPRLDYAAQIAADDGGESDRPADPNADPSRTHVRWQGGSVTTSSSAGEADEPAPVAQGESVAALVDRDERTAWHSRGGDGAFGQRARIDFDAPRDRLVLTLETPAAEEQDGSPVVKVKVETDHGSTVASITPGESTTIALPAGASTFAEVSAVGTESGTRGFDFAISEIGVRSGGVDVTPRREVVVPDAGRDVLGWSLGTQYPGRSACLPEAGRIAGPGGRPGPDAATACESDFAVAAEEPGQFTRTVTSAADSELRPVLSMRARPGSALDTLLTAGRDELSASGAADVDDPLGNALAAVDGDPGTAWRAPQAVADDDEDDGEKTTNSDSDSNSGAETQAGSEDEKATPAELDVTLPERGRIGAVRIWPADPVNGARPEVVELGLGDRTERVDLTGIRPEDDGSWIVDVPDATESEVSIRVLEYSMVRNDAGSGFERRPPAIGDVRILGTDGRALARPLGTGREPVRVPCAEGPVVRVRAASGDIVSETPMTVTSSVDALRRGEPVLAAPCGDPVRLPAGEATISVDPGPALSVDGLELSPASADRGSSLGEVRQDRADTVVSEDGPARRVMELTRASGDSGSLLVVPQSFNAGWNARIVTADGSTELEAIPVGGWQQGWILPAGTPAGATIVMDFPLDGYYRAALATGPFALVLVLWLLLARGHDRAGAASSPRRGSRRLWLAGGAVASGVIGGVPGLVLFAAAAWGVRRLPPPAAPVLVAGFLGVAAMLVAREPWPSSTWGGDSIAAQVLALAALAVMCARGAWDYSAPERDGRGGREGFAGGAGTRGRSGD